MLYSDLHSAACAGFMLDPEYNFAAYFQSTNDEVMSGLCNILEKFYPSDVEKQSLALQQLSQFRAGSVVVEHCFKLFFFTFILFIITAQWR